MRQSLKLRSLKLLSGLSTFIFLGSLVGALVGVVMLLAIPYNYLKYGASDHASLADLLGLSIGDHFFTDWIGLNAILVAINNFIAEVLDFIPLGCLYIAIFIIHVLVNSKLNELVEQCEEINLG